MCIYINIYIYIYIYIYITYIQQRSESAINLDGDIANMPTGKCITIYILTIRNNTYVYLYTF